LTLFLACRWETGTDWWSYKSLFDDIELDITFIFNVYSFDLGYVLLNALVRIFTDNYTVFLFVDSFLALSILFLFLKKHSYYVNISTFFFFVSFYVAQYMGSNRRMIAMSILLYAFYFIFKGDKKRYFFCQFVAFMFHRSSIIGILAWFIPQKRFSTKKIFWILSVAFFIGISELSLKVIDFLGNSLSGIIKHPLIEKMVFYSATNLDTVSENVNPIIQSTLSIIKRSIFLLFYLIIIRKKKNVIDDFTSYIFNIYIFSFALYVMLNGSPIFQVLSAYFAIIEIVLVGRLLIYADINIKYIITFCIFFFGFFQLLSSLNSYPELYIPYIPFWSDIHRQ
jgi:hypothetical protein